MIEYYCVDCYVIICLFCVVMQYRRCEIVEMIREIVQKLNFEKEYIKNDFEFQLIVIEEWEKEYV